MALSSRPELSDRVARGITWLATNQRLDGGWAPNSKVDQSTWVTSLAVLAIPNTEMNKTRRNAGLRWIVRQTSADSGFLERFRRRLISVPRETSAPEAWPWFPGTASWVTPTAVSMLSLRGCQIPAAKDRVELGAQFLLRRQCVDGGWNHGGNSFRSEGAPSYPETTGLALLSLRGRTGPAIEQAVEHAKKQSEDPGSAGGLGWLRLGLRAHRQHDRYTGPDFHCWTVLDTALTLLAQDTENSML